MTGVMTREELRKYHLMKNKICVKDQSIQTDPPANSLQAMEDEEGTDKTTDNDEDYSADYEDEDESEEDENEVEESVSSDLKRKVKQIFDKMKKRRYVNPEDEEYYRGLTKDEKKDICAIEDGVYDIMNSKTPLRFEILESNIDIGLKALCLKKLDQLDNMRSHTDEYYKLYQWVESVARLPLKKFKMLPVSKESSVAEISTFLNDVRSRLDTNVYGHHDTKEHIIRLLAKWIANKDANGLVIGLEGKMGVGKSSLCLEICKALGLPYGFVSLGGLSSSEYLVGHSYTYEGSKWGKIAEILMYAGYSNPIIYFDELDKVSDSRHGEEIINTLIHITDFTQNFDFRDKYFSEVPIDLSRCIIIFSYNNAELVNPILKDRMVTIKASGYTINDKLEISKKHMLPKIIEEYGFQSNDVIIDDEVLTFIINLTEDEEGVRKLRRSLEDIISQLNVMRLLQKGFKPKEEEPIKFPCVVTQEIAKKLVTKRKENNASFNSMYM